MKLSNAQTLYLQSIPPDRSPVTRQWYERMTTTFIAWCGDIPLAELNQEQITTYRSHLLNQPHSPATINAYQRAVKIWLAWLHKQNHLSQPIHQALVKLRHRPGPKAISERDMKAIANRATDPRDQALVKLLAASGMRREALHRLTLDDLQFCRTSGRWLRWEQMGEQCGNWRGRATIKEKGNTTNVIYFGGNTCQALFAWLRARPSQQSRQLFTGRRGPLTADGIAGIIRRLSHQAGTTGPTNPHAWRHAVAKGMIRRGADIRTVADTLGHKDPYFTAATYLNWTEEEREANQLKFGLDL